MQIIPFQTGPASFNIFVLLEEENLTRMRAYDPAQLGLDKLPARWNALRLGMVIIGYANAKDIATMKFMMEHGEIGKALQFLSRGFVFDPARGDTDAPYRSVFPEAEEP